MTYKERARAFCSAVNDYDVATLERMVDEDYIQHYPFVPTGRAAFLALIPKLKASGSKIHNVRMLEDGQHVIMHHRWENAAPFGYDGSVAFHIVRLDERSLIAEHWSVMMRDIPDNSGSSLADGPTRIEDVQMTVRNKARTAQLFKTLGGASLSYHKQHKIFGEGNFSLSISEGVFHGTPSAIYDLFHFEGDKTADHWRIVQEIPTKNLANHNTMFNFGS